MEYRVQGQSIRSQVVPAEVEAFLDGGKSYLRVWSGPFVARWLQKRGRGYATGDPLALNSFACNSCTSKDTLAGC